MSLKPGYKQTEIGVMPEDWTVKELGEIAEFTNGKPNEQNVVVDGRYLLVTLDSINIRGELKTSHKQTNLLDDSLRAGDIVTVLSDIAHGNLLGLCGVIPLDHKYVLNQRMGRLRVRSGYDPGFIRLKVNRNQSHFKMRGQGTSQRHIYRRDFDCLKIGLPNSVAEQKAIAEVLSDVDALIDSLEALLTKKRNIKTGVMQELLTGRTRLPGFTADWHEVRLGEFAEITMGQSPDSLFYNGNGVGIPLIQGNADIKSRKSIARVWTTVASKKAKKHDVLLTVRAPVGAVAIASQDVCLGRGVCALAPKSGDMMFLFHSLVKSELKWKVFEQGSTFTAANSSQVADFIIDVPQEIEEQQAIAAVLSDMDDEIEALDKRLAKTRDLKQGMAQELLTGRTRLV
jgi:type I restriction enzyme S subunit